TWLDENWNVGGRENWFLSAPPKATTQPAVAVKGTSAVLKGIVDPEGTKTSYYFEYGLTIANGNPTKSTNVNYGFQEGTSTAEAALTELKPETTYNFRLVAVNTDGMVVNGANATFTTGPAPVVATGQPSAIGVSTATLNGAVNPRGQATTYRFEYGPTTSYGTKVPVPNASVGSGTVDVAVSQAIAGLEAGREYHYRVVATNPEGTVFGDDAVFFTKDLPPLFTVSFGKTGSSNGQFQFPRGIDLAANGDVFVADDGNDRVQRFSSSGAYLSQFGSSGSGNGQLDLPTDVAVTSGGDVWVTDALNARVEKFSAAGAYLGQFGSYGAGNGQFYEPSGLEIDAAGNIWVVDSGADRIQQFSPSGAFIRSVGTYGTGNGQFNHPAAIAFDSAGNLWVGDSRNHRVQKLSSEGKYLSQFGTYGTGNGQFAEPSALDFTSAGHLVVTDRETGRAQVFSTSGEYLTQFGGGTFWEPDGIATGPGGVIYVANSRSNRVEKWLEP
ncbi:MAG TPA: hypothetical protein VGB06_01070, partial [Solirubrobacterales bacterium]